MRIDSTEPFFNYYREIFVPAYGDLLTFSKQSTNQFRIPEEILLGIENCFSHIAQFFNPRIDEITRIENLNKSLNHLERLTLDCYKILWINLQLTLSDIAKDSRSRKFCIDGEEHQFMSCYYQFLDLVEDARKFEMSNVGVNVAVTIDQYISAINLGKTAHKMVKLEKKLDLDTIQKRWIIKANIHKSIGLFILSSIATFILYLLDEFFI